MEPRRAKETRSFNFKEEVSSISYSDSEMKRAINDCALSIEIPPDISSPQNPASSLSEFSEWLVEKLVWYGSKMPLLHLKNHADRALRYLDTLLNCDEAEKLVLKTRFYIYVIESGLPNCLVCLHRGDFLKNFQQDLGKVVWSQSNNSIPTSTWHCVREFWSHDVFPNGPELDGALAVPNESGDIFVTRR